MEISEVILNKQILKELITFSKDWETEDSCYGYRANTKDDIEGNRIFLAYEDNKIIGYLFGHISLAKKMKSIIPDDTPYFEIEELFVAKDFRNKGVGQKLFNYVENILAKEVDYLVLSTATKNHKAILHFYIDELQMQFFSARLYKNIRKDSR